MKTVSDFTRLASQRTWDKDVAVWLGPESSFTAALPGGSTVGILTLDLLDLFNEAALPDSEDDVVHFLRRALRERLSSVAPPLGHRRILVVKSVGLLVRYNLGLKEFFDWFCGDRGLVVLLIEGTPEKVELPSEIECHPRAIVDYFDRPDLAKHCFSAA
ncbi:MAG: hypothetical protein ACR2OZ_02305 [Verrucomicrobiales bacterium]